LFLSQHRRLYIQPCIATNLLVTKQMCGSIQPHTHEHGYKERLKKECYAGLQVTK